MVIKAGGDSAGERKFLHPDAVNESGLDPKGEFPEHIGLPEAGPLDLARYA
jgi:hypothetical protein